MNRLETVDLGTYRGDEYFLTGFVEPAPVDGIDYDPDECADEYGVVLARPTSLGSNDEVVRMDTAHGQPHLDLVYLPSSAHEQRKVRLDEGYTYERMKQYLLANWRRFAALSLRYADSAGDE